MRKMLLTILVGAALAQPAYADINVFACEPEWGALTKELAGDKASIYTATTGLQDPHQVQARPSLIAKARAADITVCTGAELESAWLPMVAQQAANSKIKAGAPGSFEAASFVKLLDVPTRFDRADGDVHPAGNPHIQTDPRNLLIVAKALSARFAELDAANASTYAARYADFAGRWSAAIAKWEAAAAPLKGAPIGVQHAGWVYMIKWLGLKQVVVLEPKPGVPASSGYLAQVLGTLEREPVKMIIRAAYQDDRASTFISKRAKVPAVLLPFTVGGTDEAKDLFSLYDDTIKRLLAAVKP
ncbi:MAG: zinc ABC transporter substrate-binding protein [Micropepsaceae bacterium]